MMNTNRRSALVLLMGTIWLGCVDSPPEIAYPEGVEKVSIPDELLATINNTPDFIAALDIVGEDGMTLDQDAAYLVESPGFPEEKEVAFPIVPDDATERNGDAYVIYQQSEDPISGLSTAMVFFIPAIAVPMATEVSETPQPILWGCDPWGPWQSDSGPYCAYRWLCGKKNNHEALFIDESRVKNCKNGYKVQQRRKLIHCGC